MLSASWIVLILLFGSALCLVAWASIGSIASTLSCRASAQMPTQARRALIVVLGDFGRSPRMQYHSVSLAQQGGFQVDVVAYGGSQPVKEVLNSDKISLHLLPEQPAWLQRLPGVLRLVLKGIFQLCSLLWLLLARVPSPDVLLLQVPPAIPALPCCWLAARWHGALLVIDWHNFAYSIMGLNLGPRHLLVRVAEGLERFWGRRADRHVCVSRAMQRELATHWRITSTVFHDRPPARFRPTPLADAHELWLRLMPSLALPVHEHDFCSLYLQPLLDLSKDPATQAEPGSICTHADAQRLLPGLSTSSRSSRHVHGPEHESSSQRVLHMRGRHLSLCTRQASQGAPVALRTDRPAIAVSSTSWTPDEDFSILLDAAQLYDEQAAQKGSGLPALLLLVTGRGPQKSMYQAAMHKLELRRVAFRTLWLEPGDYPLLLGTCDVGVSLHTSSSGLDLPMKVVDMFGSGLPVCAASYSSIDELVQEGKNGLLFSTAPELAACLARMLTGFPGSVALGLSMKQQMQSMPFDSWEITWPQLVSPVLERSSSRSRNDC